MIDSDGWVVTVRPASLRLRLFAGCCAWTAERGAPLNEDILDHAAAAVRASFKDSDLADLEAQLVKIAMTCALGMGGALVAAMTEIWAQWLCATVFVLSVVYAAGYLLRRRVVLLRFNEAALAALREEIPTLEWVARGMRFDGYPSLPFDIRTEGAQDSPTRGGTGSPTTWGGSPTRASPTCASPMFGSSEHGSPSFAKPRANSTVELPETLALWADSDESTEGRTVGARSSQRSRSTQPVAATKVTRRTRPLPLPVSLGFGRRRKGVPQLRLSRPSSPATPAQDGSPTLRSRWDREPSAAHDGNPASLRSRSHGTPSAPTATLTRGGTRISHFAATFEARCAECGDRYDNSVAHPTTACRECTPS